MEKTPKEMLKAYVDSQKFSSTTEIMDAMKEMFRDVLQQVMESELDTALGYEKSQRMSDSGVENKPRNGYLKKTVKTRLGAVDVKVPRDRNGEYEPQIIGKYSRNADGMEEKILGLYACGMSQRDISEQIKNLYDVHPQQYILPVTSIGNGVIRIVQEKDSQSDPARPLCPADGVTEH